MKTLPTLIFTDTYGIKQKQENDTFCAIINNIEVSTDIQRKSRQFII